MFGMLYWCYNTLRGEIKASLLALPKSSADTSGMLVFQMNGFRASSVAASNCYWQEWVESCRGSFGWKAAIGQLWVPAMLSRVPTDLSKAIRDGDLRNVQALLSRNPAYLEAPSPSVGGNWLHFAVRFPDTGIVDYLLSLGINVNSPDAEGVGPLAEAAAAGRYEHVRLLLDNGAALDVTTSVVNPLFAAISGSVQTNVSWPKPTGEAPRIIELLLERGIDSLVRYNTRTMSNMDAVAFAMMIGAADLARLIAAWNARTGKGDVEAMLKKARDIAEANTRTRPLREQYRPS